MTTNVAYRELEVPLPYSKACECPDYKINCLTAKEWIKSQIGVWEFFYEKRDVRDKKQHPATFPISLAKQCIQLFTHVGELVVDPFCGSGTTLVAANDLNRPCLGFDINENYIALANDRVAQQKVNGYLQTAVLADAKQLSKHLPDRRVKLILTSPPYAQALNRQRLNKSRRTDERKNGQYLEIEQYSQKPNDLGTYDLARYKKALTTIFKSLRMKLSVNGHVLINVADIWWQGERIPLHIHVIQALEEAGLEFRNTIIWDRTKIVNKVGIFGWPSNYITMGTTFEFLLHFRNR